jgi:hypothetical protein
MGVLEAENATGLNLTTGRNFTIQWQKENDQYQCDHKINGNLTVIAPSLLRFQI